MRLVSKKIESIPSGVMQKVPMGQGVMKNHCLIHWGRIYTTSTNWDIRVLLDDTDGNSICYEETAKSGPYNFSFTSGRAYADITGKGNICFTLTDNADPNGTFNAWIIWEEVD